ncbi:MAG: 50S ribosomal protein L19e [Candidatus Bathyarchaeia archaeon]
MQSRRSQRRLAARLLKVGASKVWIDPEDTDRVSSDPY